MMKGKRNNLRQIWSYPNVRINTFGAITQRIVNRYDKAASNNVALALYGKRPGFLFPLCPWYLRVSPNQIGLKIRFAPSALITESLQRLVQQQSVCLKDLLLRRPPHGEDLSCCLHPSYQAAVLHLKTAVGKIFFAFKTSNHLLQMNSLHPSKPANC